MVPHSELMPALRALLGQWYELTDMPEEDFLVLFTGSGAKSLGAVFDKAVPQIGIDQIKVKVQNETGTALSLLMRKPAIQSQPEHWKTKKQVLADTEYTLFGNAEI